MDRTNKIKWTVILNPHSGGGKGKKDQFEIERLLNTTGFLFEMLISEYPRHSVLLAKHAIENGARNIIVAGGDGTLNEVVNGVLAQNSCSTKAITVGMIPVGTGNDWIKTFGIPNNYEHAILKIREGATLFQDVGKLTYFEEGKEKVRYFANMAGFGFDAQVTLNANQLKEKGSAGLLVYLLSLLKAFGQYKSQKVTIVVDGKEHSEIVFTVSVGIGKFNGGGMQQAPNAVPNNGIFEVTYIREIGIWGILTNLARLYKGTYIKDRRVVCHKAREVSIKSRNLIAGEVDGESLGESQYQIEILPQKLQVIIGDIES